jgi:nucleoid-associated protein YgaU
VAVALAEPRTVVPVVAASAPNEPDPPPVLPIGERAAREVAAALVNERDVPPMADVLSSEIGSQPPVGADNTAATLDTPAARRGRLEALLALMQEAAVPAGRTPALPAGPPPSETEDTVPRTADTDTMPTVSEDREPERNLDVAAVVRGWMEALAALQSDTVSPPAGAARPDTFPPADEPQAPESPHRELPPPVDVAVRPVAPLRDTAADAPEPIPSRPNASAAIGETPATERSPGAVPAIRAVAVEAVELSRSRPGTMIVRRGDTLWDIAERVYGDGSRYQTIYRANRDVIPRPGALRPGQVLEIPLVYD